jgi:hypothetical protein
MSCPYLEGGQIPLCRAPAGGRRGMRLPEGEMPCFSGDFSDCGLLIHFPFPEKKFSRKRIQNPGIARFPKSRPMISV